MRKMLHWVLMPVLQVGQRCHNTVNVDENGFRESYNEDFHYDESSQMHRKTYNSECVNCHILDEFTSFYSELLNATSYDNHSQKYNILSISAK